MRGGGEKGRRAADDETRRKEAAVFEEHHPGDAAAGEAEREHHGKLGAALDDAAEKHRDDAEGGEDEAESAEGFERGEVGVLDASVGGKDVGGAADVEAGVGQSIEERGPHGRFIGGRALGEEETEAGAGAERVREMILGDEELAGEDAAAQESDDAEFERAA